MYKDQDWNVLTLIRRSTCYSVIT